MSDRFHNFDRFLEENTDDLGSVSVRLFGKKWTLPADVPAAAMARAKRYIEGMVELKALLDERGEDGQVSDDEAVEIMGRMAFDYDTELRSLLGDELVDKWVELGLGHKRTQAIYWRVVAVYEDAGEGEKEPARKTTRKKTTAKNPSGWAGPARSWPARRSWSRPSPPGAGPRCRGCRT